MATTGFRLLLFMSAYAPLWILWGFKALSLRAQYQLAWLEWDLLWVAVVMLGLGAASIAALGLFLSLVGRRNPHEVTVADSFPKSGEMLGYVAPYFLPFLKLEVTDLFTQVSLVVLFGIIAAVYVRLNLVRVNPLLSLLGYHLFEVRAESGRRYWVLTKRNDIRLGERMRLADIGPSAAIELEAATSKETE